MYVAVHLDANEMQQISIFQAPTCQPFEPSQVSGFPNEHARMSCLPVETMLMPAGIYFSLLLSLQPYQAAKKCSRAPNWPTIRQRNSCPRRRTVNG